MTVQNRCNLTDRSSEDVLDVCEEAGIGFIPWFPLAVGSLADEGGPLDELAGRHGATAGQVALAWLLARSPVMLPIPAPRRWCTSRRTWPRHSSSSLPPSSRR